MDPILEHNYQIPTFIPATAQQMQSLGWQQLDVILVTGDAYIDPPHIGVAVIGKVLLNAGCRVGIIARPDISSDRGIAIRRPANMMP
jgi:hypothetical protein